MTELERLLDPTSVAANRSGQLTPAQARELGSRARGSRLTRWIGTAASVLAIAMMIFIASDASSLAPSALIVAAVLAYVVVMVLRPWSDPLGADVRAGWVESVRGTPVMSHRTYGPGRARSIAWVISIGGRSFRIEQASWLGIAREREFRAYYLPASSTLLSIEAADDGPGEPVRSIDPVAVSRLQWLPLPAGSGAVLAAFVLATGQDTAGLAAAALAYAAIWLALTIVPLDRFGRAGALWIRISAWAAMLFFAAAFALGVVVTSGKGDLGSVAGQLSADEATWCNGHWGSVLAEGVAFGADVAAGWLIAEPAHDNAQYIVACQKAALAEASIPPLRRDVPQTTLFGGILAAAGVVAAGASLVRRRLSSPKRGAGTDG